MYIMRGVSGSGKSTMARQLAGPNGAIHSTDSYFMIGGRYVFDPTKLADNHARNQASFELSLRRGISVVVCDNTNARIVHVLPYLRLAREYGYQIYVVEMAHPDPQAASARNAHGVTSDGVRRMISRWEPWPDDMHPDVSLLRVAQS